MTESSSTSKPVSPTLVAILGWLVPGSGYLLIGQRHRAIIIGSTILFLFVGGLLIGGARVIEVPGFDAKGEIRQISVQQGGTIIKAPAIGANPINEIRDKPWFIPQVLAGPVALGAAMWSVHLAHSGPDGKPRGYPSTSRINDIGSLYLSVAGLLNLMTIIDSAWRASHAANAHAAGVIA